MSSFWEFCATTAVLNYIFRAPIRRHYAKKDLDHDWAVFESIAAKKFMPQAVLIQILAPVIFVVRCVVGQLGSGTKALCL